MATALTVKDLIDGLSRLPGSRQLRVIFTAEEQLEVKPRGKGVYVWSGWRRTRPLQPKPLAEKVYSFVVAGLPRSHDGHTMIPVIWKRDLIGWIDRDEFIEATRLGLLNDKFTGWASDEGHWPGSNPVQTALRSGDSVEILGETDSHVRIGEGVWVDKNFVDL